MIKQRITIDPSVVTDNNLSLGEFLYTLMFIWGYNPEEVIEEMVTEGKAYYENDTAFPKKSTIESAQKCLQRTVDVNLSLEDLEDLALKLKDIYPKGKNDMGIPWTEGKKLVAEQLKDFFAKFGNYTVEQVINATQRYVDDNKNSMYMRTLRNFIFKETISSTGLRTFSSDLYTYLENADEPKITKIDWTVNVK